MKKLWVFVVLILGAFIALNAQAGIDDGLVAHYPFEGNAYDASGNGHDGIEAGGVIYTEGALGQAVQMNDPLNQKVIVPDAESLDLHNSFSIALWVNPSEFPSTNGYLFSKYWSSEQYAGGEFYSGIYGLNNDNTGKFFFTVFNYDSNPRQYELLISENSILLNSWTHVVMTFDNGHMRLYINGQLDQEIYSSITQTTTREYSYDDIWIGNLAYYEHGFSGVLIDEVYYYNRAIYEAEILELYTQGKTSDDLIGEIANTVISLNLANGISNSLDNKLESALGALDDVNENNDTAAINSLNAFVNSVEAQRGNKLSDEEADQLIAVAQSIIAKLESL